MPLLMPETTVPSLELPLVQGETWRLQDQTPAAFTLLVFYRGWHCPQCKKQLTELDGMLKAFAEVGIGSVLAISGDDADRAERTVKEWELSALPVAHGLTVEQMREWGLYVSRGVKDPEPVLFNEPGLFLVRPDRALYSAHVQSTPFARPHLSNLLQAVAFINDNAYPARGEA